MRRSGPSVFTSNCFRIVSKSSEPSASGRSTPALFIMTSMCLAPSASRIGVAPSALVISTPAATFTPSASSSGEVVRHAAEHMANTYRLAGVKVVTIEIQRGRVSDTENFVSGFTSTDYLEVRKNRAGSGGLAGTPNIPSNERGHNFNTLGGLSAVDSSVAEKFTSDPEKAAIAIGNLGAHEIAHDVTPFHVEGDPVMDPPKGADDPNWLFKDHQFGRKMQISLQNKFNKPGEKPLTTIVEGLEDKKKEDR